MCAAGDTVRISDGDYPVSKLIAVTRPVRIESVNGPDKTSVYATEENQRVFNLNCAGSVLSGLTVSNVTFTKLAPATVAFVREGTITNSVFTKNTNKIGSYGGGFVEGYNFKMLDSKLVGNYGGAWWQQREDFQRFHGPILFTSNCIVPPIGGNNYEDKIFTTNSAGFPGSQHIPTDKEGKKDFTALIQLAKNCPPPDPIPTSENLETETLLGGFAHKQVAQLADRVVAAVKAGKIRQFVVMAGCDGRMKNREYYTEFARQLPKATVILTAGCAKYRYNRLDLGDIDGIPRMLDAGQCNDCYSLVIIALKLKEALGLKSINELPILFNIAWYEQKAVAVLLALLSLGIQNLHIGPSIPTFMTPDMRYVLKRKFNIGTITTVENDLETMLQ